MNISIVLAFLLLPLCAAFPGEWCDGKFVRLPTNEEDVSEIHFCTKAGNGVELYNITDEFDNILMDGVEIVCVETAARLADVVVRRAKDEPVTLTVTPDGHLILSTSVESRILRGFFFFNTCFVPIKRCPTGHVMLVPKVEGEEYTVDLCGRMDVAWDFYLNETFSEDTYEASELMVWCNKTMAEIALHPGWAGGVQSPLPIVMRAFEREAKQPIVMRAAYDNGHPKLYIGEEVVEKYSLSDNSYTCLTERLIARDNFFANDTVKHECAGQLLRYPTTAGDVQEIRLCADPGNYAELYNIIDEAGYTQKSEVEIVCLEKAARFANVVVQREKDEAVILSVSANGILTLNTSLDEQFLDHLPKHKSLCFAVFDFCPYGQPFLLPKVEGEEYSVEFCGTLDSGVQYFAQVDEEGNIVTFKVTCNHTSVTFVDEHVRDEKTYDREPNAPLVMRAVYEDGHPNVYIGSELVHSFDARQKDHACMFPMETTTTTEQPQNEHEQDEQQFSNSRKHVIPDSMPNSLLDSQHSQINP